MSHLLTPLQPPRQCYGCRAAVPQLDPCRGHCREAARGECAQIGRCMRIQCAVLVCRDCRESHAEAWAAALDKTYDPKAANTWERCGRVLQRWFGGALEWWGLG
jgi:hypothetical protein